MPGGYLSVSQFASSYGQLPQNTTVLKNYLAQYGISASAYPDGLDVTANGTAGEFDQALSIQQKQYSVPAVRGSDGQPGTPAKLVHGSADVPLLPYQIAQHVLSVLGITINYPSFATNAVHTPQAEPGATVDSTAGDAQSPEDFAHNYNLDRHRVGFWNPSIYRFATQPGSPFTPLGASGTSNDNLYYTGTHGQTYNLGSGLGTPDLSQLAADFARQTDRAGHRR